MPLIGSHEWSQVFSSQWVGEVGLFTKKLLIVYFTERAEWEGGRGPLLVLTHLHCPVIMSNVPWLLQSGRQDWIIRFFWSQVSPIQPRLQ